MCGKAVFAIVARVHGFLLLSLSEFAPNSSSEVDITCVYRYVRTGTGTFWIFCAAISLHLATTHITITVSSKIDCKQYYPP